MAHKRPRSVHVDQLKSFNLFTAFGEDGKLKAPRPNLEDLESDEEEDVEQFKAKLSRQGKGKGKTNTAPKKKTKKKKYDDSDDDADDEVVDLLASPPRKSNENVKNVDSPSPPPPPEFDDKMVAEIRRKNKNAARTLHKLEDRMRSYKMSKALAAMDNVSPVLNSPSQFIDVDNFVRETITIKVRSRNGLLRFEDYPMNQTLEKVFIDLAVSEGVEPRKVRVTRKGDNLSMTDTPSSINLHVADILDYVIVEGTMPAIEWYSTLTEEDFVRVVLRTREKNSKTLSKKIAKMETFEKIFLEFSELHDTPLQRLHFNFDGDDIRATDTPQDLDMSEENVIDVIIT